MPTSAQSMRPPKKTPRRMPSESMQIKSMLRPKAAQAAEDSEEGRKGFLEEVAPRLTQ